MLLRGAGSRARPLAVKMESAVLHNALRTLQSAIDSKHDNAGGTDGGGTSAWSTGGGGAAAAASACDVHTAVDEVCRVIADLIQYDGNVAAACNGVKSLCETPLCETSRAARAVRDAVTAHALCSLMVMAAAPSSQGKRHMRSHEEFGNAAVLILDALGALVQAFPVLGPELVDCGACSLAERIIRHSPADVILAIKACKFLDHVVAAVQTAGKSCHALAAVQEHLNKSALGPLLGRMLLRHLHHDAAMSQTLCNLLARLAVAAALQTSTATDADTVQAGEEDFATRVGRDGEVCATLVLLLEWHSANISLCVSAWRLAAILARSNAINAAILVESGILQTLAQVLDQYDASSRCKHDTTRCMDAEDAADRNEATVVQRESVTEQDIVEACVWTFARLISSNTFVPVLDEVLSTGGTTHCMISIARRHCVSRGSIRVPLDCAAMKILNAVCHALCVLANLSDETMALHRLGALGVCDLMGELLLRLVLPPRLFTSRAPQDTAELVRRLQLIQSAGEAVAAMAAVDDYREAIGNVSEDCCGRVALLFRTLQVTREAERGHRWDIAPVMRGALDAICAAAVELSRGSTQNIDSLVAAGICQTAVSTVADMLAQLRRAGGIEGSGDGHRQVRDHADADVVNTVSHITQMCHVVDRLAENSVSARCALLEAGAPCVLAQGLRTGMDLLGRAAQRNEQTTAAATTTACDVESDCYAAAGLSLLVAMGTAVLSVASSHTMRSACGDAGMCELLVETLAACRFSIRAESTQAACACAGAIVALALVPQNRSRLMDANVFAVAIGALWTHRQTAPVAIAMCSVCECLICAPPPPSRASGVLPPVAPEPTRSAVVSGSSIFGDADGADVGSQSQGQGQGRACAEEYQSNEAVEVLKRVRLLDPRQTHTSDPYPRTLGVPAVCARVAVESRAILEETAKIVGFEGVTTLEAQHQDLMEALARLQTALS